MLVVCLEYVSLFSTKLSPAGSDDTSVGGHAAMLIVE